MIANCSFAKLIWQGMKGWSGKQELQLNQNVTKVSDWVD